MFNFLQKNLALIGKQLVLLTSLAARSTSFSRAMQVITKFCTSLFRGQSSSLVRPRPVWATKRRPGVNILAFFPDIYPGSLLSWTCLGKVWRKQKVLCLQFWDFCPQFWEFCPQFWDFCPQIWDFCS